ncbi:hypothetical protein [Brevibacillus migulae]|uniref:hypothetical protein n=1 Tax=Brevibacillus migulae TaxID=1644114 RepID=UPI00106EA5F0|nr:hypothetical protein [Brevibacillus migulae]
MRNRYLSIGILLIVVCAAIIAYFQWFPRGAGTPAKATTPVAVYHDPQGFSQVSTVVDQKLAVYNGKGWDRFFWAGVNLGSTTPGHFPGELSPTREDYLRWFEQMVEMNNRVIRIYTIMPPYFYEALAEFNARQTKPLMVLHGIWSPEEELIGADSLGRDAYNKDITAAFESEIHRAVGAIHGKMTIEPKPGHASGTYTADISPYVLGWVVGTEWFPLAVQVTDQAHANMPAYQGTYFRGNASATPFENWLARMLDTVAQEEMKYGWQRPVSFTNWLTTDPLHHPNEPLEQEDLVSVDPMHVEPTDAWKAGYFAAYHVYPYYPDFLRFQPEYLNYVDKHGNKNPYAGYLHDLREHHKGIPLIVAEFGLPSSRGIAHFAPNGYNQGMHTEQEQGRMLVDLLQSIHDEELDGAMLFEWHDEWFKFTWNTYDMETNRAMWRNRLTNEEHFGVIAVEPSPWKGEALIVDGEKGDWDQQDHVAALTKNDYSIKVSHDESDLHLILEKKAGDWDLKKDNLLIGFDTIAGGAQSTDANKGSKFPAGAETMFLLQNGEAEIRINSAYDLLTWTYGVNNRLIDVDPRYANDSAGFMLSWRLPTDLGFYLPQTKEKKPFHAVEVGKMINGIADPKHPSFNSLADWYAKGNVLEIRIPWMLLGFTDPSSKKVWNYLYKAGRFEEVSIDHIGVMPILTPQEANAPVQSLTYQWDNWTSPHYHERKKLGFTEIQKVYKTYEAPLP